MTTTISAADNPALVNDLVQKAVAPKEMPQPDVEITSPSDTLVILPGGFVNAAGEVITEAEVRELTGNDEEAIARTTTIGKALLTILNRGTVRIGSQKSDERLLDQLLSSDRDMLILSIFKATFGKTTDVKAYCSGCDALKDVTLDLDTDIEVKVLADPINDRVFTVKGKKQEYTVQLPTGVAHKELLTNSDKNSAELTTMMLENCVLKIGNSPVVSKLQVQNLGLIDRRLIAEEIDKRVAGPQFSEVNVVCPDCESEVRVPINFGTLFRI